MQNAESLQVTFLYVCMLGFFRSNIQFFRILRMRMVLCETVFESCIEIAVL